jgi:integrase
MPKVKACWLSQHAYLGSSAFKHLGSDTQQVRRHVLDAFSREHGDKLVRHMPRKFVAAYLDAMEPSRAKNYLKALRAVSQHCISLDLIDDDPTLGVRLRPMKGDGFHCWTEDEITQFEAAHPIGSRERLAFALGLYTGQRRGDVIRMGRQHLSDCLDPRLLELGVRKMLFVRQQKTGKELKLPVHPELQALQSRALHEGGRSGAAGACSDGAARKRNGNAEGEELACHNVRSWGEPDTPG